MKRNLAFSFGFALLLSTGLLTAGCSGDNGSPSPADAGGKDALGGTGGKSGIDGAVGTGGKTGTGGSTAAGGATSAGGATGAAGGATGAGGATSGAGGAIGTGGSTAGGTGGNTGVGGSQLDGGGTGGAAGADGGGQGGSVDVGTGSDTVDAPLPGSDVASGDDSAAAADGGVPVLLDSGSLDTEGLDAAAIDTVVVLMDAEGIDAAVDESGSGPSLDAGVDATPNPIPCTSVVLVTGGQSGNFGTAGNYCFATCDDIEGWGGSNLDGRTLLLVNEQDVAISAVGAMPLPTPKVLGTYTVFQFNGSADARTYASIYWWGTYHACAAPDGGLGL